MAVDTPHPSYSARELEWQKMRDVIEGETAMRDGAKMGGRYVRKASGMDGPEFASYVDHASFFEATGRTLEGLTGLAFYNPPTVTLPDKLKPLLADATSDGVPLVRFMESCFEEQMSINRVGVMVDHPPRDPNVRTIRDEEAAGQRPFVSRYVAENILNWTEARVNGSVQLVEVRLLEVEEEAMADFATRRRRRIRVLELVPIVTGEGARAQGRWQYQQRLFVEPKWTIDGGTEEQVADKGAGPTAGLSTDDAFVAEGGPIIPTMPGDRPLDYIPFWIINSTDQNAQVRRPTMIGLANLNASHFNTTAALENALFWTGNPQPYICGVETEGAPDMLLGSGKAWLFKDPSTKVDMLTFGTEGLASLEKRLDRLEQQMAVLGARMLAAEKKAPEAADTARIHRQGEISIVAGACSSLGAAFTDILEVVRDWSGESGEARVEMNTEFFDKAITVDDALGAMKVWQAGLMDIEDLVRYLKRAQLVSADRTPDAIKSANDTSPIQPIMAGLTDSSGGLRVPPEPGVPRPTLRVPQRPTA